MSLEGLGLRPDSITHIARGDMNTCDVMISDWHAGHTSVIEELGLTMNKTVCMDLHEVIDKLLAAGLQIMISRNQDSGITHVYVDHRFFRQK